MLWFDLKKELTILLFNLERIADELWFDLKKELTILLVVLSPLI